MAIMERVRSLFGGSGNIEERTSANETIRERGLSYTGAEDVGNWTTVQGISGFYSFNATYIQHNIFDRIARDMSMVEFKHLKDGVSVTGSDFVYALNVQANRLQTASDFIYSIVWDLFKKGDVFVRWDKTTKEFENLNINSIKFLVDDSGTVWLQGRTSAGNVVEFLYKDIIHLRHKPTGVFFSQKIDDVDKLLNIVAKTNNAILEEISNGSELRGVLKIPTQIADDLKGKKVEDFKGAIRGGIGTLDAMTEFVELKNNYTANTENSKEALRQLFRYFGVNENILNSSYTKEEYDAYIQSTIAPLCKKLSQAFTGALLTRFQAKDTAEGENAGRKKETLIFELNTFKLASIEKQATFLSAFVSSGVGTTNEARDLMDLPPIEGGDTVRVSLNYVNAQIADMYQLTNASDNTSVTDIDPLKGGEKEDEDNNI